jgi:DNA-binding transcriptional MerR regulator
MTETSTFGISQLASEFKITARAIRFYEDQGMITPARAGSGGRIRVYSQRDRARLKLLLRGKRLGFSLQEIKELLDMYETPADSMPQLTRFLEVLDARRQSLRQQLADLNQLLADIDLHHGEAERTLRALQAGMELRPGSSARSGQPVPVEPAPSRIPSTETPAMQNAAS